MGREEAGSASDRLRTMIVSNAHALLGNEANINRFWLRACLLLISDTAQLRAIDAARLHVTASCAVAHIARPLFLARPGW